MNFEKERKEMQHAEADYEKLFSICVQSAPFDEGWPAFQMEGYDYDRCDTFQDLVHFLMNEDSLVPEDGGAAADVDFEIVRGELPKNQSSSQAHGSVPTSSDQSNSPDVQNIEKEKKRLKTNEKAREKRQAQKQKEEDLQNRLISVEEENSSLSGTINKMKDEISQLLHQMEPQVDHVCHRLCQMQAGKIEIDDDELKKHIAFLQQLYEIKPEWVNNIVNRVQSISSMQEKNRLTG